MPSAWNDFLTLMAFWRSPVIRVIRRKSSVQGIAPEQRCFMHWTAVPPDFIASSHNGVFVVGSHEGRKANPVCVRFKPDRLWRTLQVWACQRDVYGCKLSYTQDVASLVFMSLAMVCYFDITERCGVKPLHSGGMEGWGERGGASTNRNNLMDLWPQIANSRAPYLLSLFFFNYQDKVLQVKNI